MAVDAALSLQPLLSEEGRRDPYSCYADLHRHGQAGRLDPADGYSVVAHGYEAVGRVLRDPAFLQWDADFLDRSGRRWREHAAVRTLRDSIFMTNGADHARVRRLFTQTFTPRRVAGLAPAVEQLTDRMLDQLAARGAAAPVDFMAEFALPLPSDVIGELLGVPEADRAWFPDRVRAFGDILELGRTSWAQLVAADAAATELTGYFAELVAARRVDPRDDLISALVQARDGAGSLTDAELLANLITMFNAGFVTTTHLLGNGLTLLLDHPGGPEALRERPELAASYVEEILRFEPPVHFGVRWAVRPTEIMGVPVAQGESVLVLMAAANRDPRRFADPDTFDPLRADNQHLSFSAGGHYCLGAALSRLEGVVALPRVATRFPELRLAGPAPERNQLMLRGYDRLPVHLGPSTVAPSGSP